jgi:hypothetical protein
MIIDFVAPAYPDDGGLVEAVAVVPKNWLGQIPRRR